MPGVLEGPLGPLRNMFWDPVRAKYFPNPRQSTAVPNQPRQEAPSTKPPSPTRRRRVIPSADMPIATGGQNAQAGPGPSSSEHSRQKVSAYRRVRGVGTGFRSPAVSGLDQKARIQGVERDYWTNLQLEGVDNDIFWHCPPRIVDLIENHQGNGGYMAYFDDGMLMGRMSDTHRPDRYYQLEVQVEPWIKPDIVRSERHPRAFLLEYPRKSHHQLPPGCNLGSIAGIKSPIKPEDFIHSSFGKSLALAYDRAIIRFDFNHEEPTRNHLLADRGTSDIMAIDHSCSNMVYAGLRNSRVLSGDFRDSSRRLDTIVDLNHKAITKVKRLCDSVVPFGLLVSGMSDKLVIFDIRFTKQPLREHAGHVNQYYGDLGITITPNGRYLIAGQSDRRVRAWSLHDGQRLVPEAEELADSKNVLTRVYKERVTAISAGEATLKVASGRTIYHFGPGHPGPAHVGFSDCPSDHPPLPLR